MMLIMRYPEGHKEAVRERIVDAASRALRRHGIEGVSIPALMKEAGLTHGGFYTHFENRDALVAEAVTSAAEATGAHVFGAELTLEESLAKYLSQGHVDRPEEGCVLSSLGTEGSRQPPPIRKAFAHAAVGLLGLLQSKLEPERRSTSLSDETLARGAMLVGAVVLGRLVRDPALSKRILSAARERIRQ